jgi:ubiquinone/menaquinone biosynthesis C-methylase UbiE
MTREILKLIPAIAPNSKIHDNGCGYGAVTNEILASPSTPKDVHVTATDVSAGWFIPLAERTEKESLPVEVKEMDACELTMPDSVFDLSIANFVFFALKDPVQAATHVKRTLKPGGTAVVTIWDRIPWRNMIIETHHKVRGADAPRPPYLTDNFTTEKLKSVLKEAGWENVEYTPRPAHLAIKDLREWVRLAWTILGRPQDGWTQHDEDTWDEAVDSIVKGLEEMCLKDEEGQFLSESVATVAVWRKEA